MPLYNPIKASNETSFTPSSSQGFGTLADVDLYWVRRGDMLKVSGRFTLGTSTSVSAQLGLPTGLTIRSGINNRNCGTFGRGVGSQTNKGGFILGGGGNTYVNFTTSDVIGSNSADPTTSALGITVGGSGDILFIEFEVPIEGWSW